MLKRYRPTIYAFGVLALMVGCAQFKSMKTTDEIRVALEADVLFEYDKADIRPQAQQDLKRAAALIREHVKHSVRIEGYSDAKGTAKYNQKLSEHRAHAVKDWLVEKEGLKDVKFIVEGFGETKPVAPNTKPDGSDDPEGRQKNRRVEIIVN
jgi:outer membrane protein OmpA-like peptidoglycan-associated protein